MKMQQSQPHGLREPLAKKCNIALWLCTFLFPHLLEVGRSTVEPKYAINYCNLQGSHKASIMTGPAIQSIRQDTLDISDTPETSDYFRYSRNFRYFSKITSDCWLLLVVLACGKLVSKDSNANSDSLDLNIGSNHTVLHSLWDLLFPQLKKVEVRPGLPWVILERATCPLHGKDLGAIGVVHGNCRYHRPVPGLQE